MTEEESARRFDAGMLSWEPDRLEATMPGLVGWHQTQNQPGSLVAIPLDRVERPIWEAPTGQDWDFRIDSVDPAGRQMYGIAFERTEPFTSHELLFRADGSVDEMPLPEGFEGVSALAFVGDDAIVTVYHAGDEYQTRLGFVDDENRWHDLQLVGSVPDHQFIDWVSADAASGTIAVVLKLAGGTGNRDDDALVLAKRAGNELRVESEPFWDDAVLGCSILHGGDAVAFGRRWSEPIFGSTQYVIAEWSGTEWLERFIAPQDNPPVLMERGGTLAASPDGSFWIRRVAPDTNESGTDLIRIDGPGGIPQETGITVTDILWYSWIEGPQ